MNITEWSLDSDQDSLSIYDGKISDFTHVRKTISTLVYKY